MWQLISCIILDLKDVQLPVPILNLKEVTDFFAKDSKETAKNIKNVRGNYDSRMTCVYAKKWNELFISLNISVNNQQAYIGIVDLGNAFVGKSILYKISEKKQL